MRKDQLVKVLENPTKELNILKIGALIRARLPLIIELDLISEFEKLRVQNIII